MDEKKDTSKSNDMSTINDFDQLLDMVRVDNNLVDNLTNEQVTELRKRLNPYGRTIEGSGKFTCLSITNLSEQYMRRFLMTSLVGFLYRRCDEHMLEDGEPPCPMDDFKNFMKTYDGAVKDATMSKEWLRNFNDKKLDEKKLTFEQKASRLRHIKKIERGEGFKHRLIVRKFLDDLFNFNPDKHVRSAYSHNPLDTERVVPAKVKIKKTKKNKLTKKCTTPLDAKRSNSKLVKNIPPADTFHRWKYYTDSNYEEIRTATQDLYCEKPDLEFAINPYDQFDSEDDAKRFVQKHKNEVIADVLTLTNSKWNLCGSFKKNRERINFYNEKTAVIEEIFKQIEQDKKLGADLMRKRVSRKKRKNVLETGDDPLEFKEYQKNNTLSMDSKNLSDDSKDTKSSFSIHEECPYDAVQVDVFDFRKGGQTVKKSEFFTQAEDPKRLDSFTVPENKRLH